MTGSFEKYSLSGLWHVHTNVTDGANTVEELLEFATDEGFPLIAFTEHVRRSPTYDFHAFYDSVTTRATEYDLECVVGCEAKVLSEAGDLDVSSAVADRADVVYAAYHGTPFEQEAYLDSIHAMLDNPVVDVWAHPFAYAVREEFTFSPTELADVVSHAAAADVRLEYNLRHESLLSPDTLVRSGILGYDLHDLERWRPADRPQAVSASGDLVVNRRVDRQIGK